IIHQVFIKKFHEGLGFSRVRLAGAIIAAPLYSYFLFWMLIVHTIPTLYTYCVGDDYSQVSKIEKYYGSSTKECRYQLKSDDLKGSFPSYVCVSERFYDAAHSHVKFIGKRSSAGKLFQQAQTCR
ncbi:hypothetical protein, partial [Pseudomaricurvus sp.]|uniref:hypothetical protein n=1 Tax=Pseudomaricurvus sp. TaxID=2004510 RepID=UPI003F6BEF8E